MDGDFNLCKEAITLDKLKRIANEENTWRRNNEKYTSLIDHFYVSQHITDTQTNIRTESDHKGLLLKVEGLRKHKGLYIPIAQSGLSKKKIAEAKIKEREVYPHIHIHNYCNGNRLKKTPARINHALREESPKDLV